ncbi:MAG: small subunit ribosomal protein S3Ae [Thermoplasmata archaeon]|nr:small subunit ribosomal protein S3Ae [Thermoplasmata archaeon]
MALARARQAARRTKDRWKSKQWFKVTAPASFNNTVLAETLADEAPKLQGRTVEVTLTELTGDMKQMHIKLSFQVTDVQDLNARTQFVGHTMTSDYIRRLTRRGNSKIPAVFDLQTKDGSRVRVKPFAVTDRRCQTTQAQEIRRIMGALLTESAEKNNLSGFLADVLMGDLTNRMFKEARKVHPVRRIEIAKSEMMSAPTIEVDETPVIKLAAPEAPAAEGEGVAPMDAGEEGEKVVEDLAAGDEEE